MNFQHFYRWSSQVKTFLFHKKSLPTFTTSGLGRFGHQTQNGIQRTCVKIKMKKIKTVDLLLRPVQKATKCHQWNEIQTHLFHTSSRRHIPPVLWVFLKPLAKFSAAMTGRTVRKWFLRLGPAERKAVWAAVRRHWYIPTGICLAFAGSASVYYVSHLEETPITGRRRFIALTLEQIVKIAEAEASELIEEYKEKQFSPKDPQSLRVIQVAQRLLAANPELRRMPFKEWQIYVINDALVNACVLPSGHMFVFDGILQIADTQDQLAIILGHEMAHAVLQHGVEEISMGTFVDVFIILCLAAIWCIIPFDGIALVTHWFYDKVIKLLTHMPHSRQMEKEADKVGFMFAARACYDIRHGSILWTKMSHNEQLGDNKGKILPEWMHTHPDSLKRADYFDFILPEAQKWREDMQCPKLPLDDPREAVKALSKFVDNLVLADKTGQNLRKVPRQKP